MHNYVSVAKCHNPEPTRGRYRLQSLKSIRSLSQTYWQIIFRLLADGTKRRFGLERWCDSPAGERLAQGRMSFVFGGKRQPMRSRASGGRLVHYGWRRCCCLSGRRPGGTRRDRKITAIPATNLLPCSGTQTVSLSRLAPQQLVCNLFCVCRAGADSAHERGWRGSEPLTALAKCLREDY